MKKTSLLILLILILSSISGYLLSKATLIGRTGINLFYKQYKFLKVWWQGALVVFILLLLILLLQKVIEKNVSNRNANILHSIMIFIALGGLYLTYHDFRHTTTHRLLGERFHIGFYLFWIGWILISIFYLMQKKNEIIINEKKLGNTALPQDS